MLVVALLHQYCGDVLNSVTYPCTLKCSSQKNSNTAKNFKDQYVLKSEINKVLYKYQLNKKLSCILTTIKKPETQIKKRPMIIRTIVPAQNYRVIYASRFLRQYMKPQKVISLNKLKMKLILI